MVGRKEGTNLRDQWKDYFAGGARYTPIHLPKSIEENYTVLFSNRPFESQQEPYYRIDLGLSYEINMPKVSHTIMFDVQKVTNRQNLHDKYSDSETQMIDSDTQTCLFPFINYRIDFKKYFICGSWLVCWTV